MYKIKTKLHKAFLGLPSLLLVVFCFTLFTKPALAVSLNLLDSFDLSYFVPSLLEIMMNAAITLYKYFVGNGTGILYLFIYLFLAFYIALYLFKMFIPKDWVSLLGLSDGGEMWSDKANGWSVAENVLKPCARAVIAGILLLQIKPVYVTEYLVNPFLEFGSYYTQDILKTINPTLSSPDENKDLECPLKNQDWLSKRSCNFLTNPVHVIAQENNRVIAYGFRFLSQGLLGMATLIPHGGKDLLNICTGLILISAFTASNMFMTLLIIQAIFNFGMALILYPFKVITWVVKKSDKWFDIMPVFSQIADALQKMIITMIACAIILCVNIALVRALFKWNQSTFIAAAGGVSNTNVPTITSIANYFGQHFMLWLSAILTFFVMQNIFKMTRERLNTYSGVKNKLYEDATSSGKELWKKTKAAPENIKTLWNAGSKAVDFVKSKVK